MSEQVQNIEQERHEENLFTNRGNFFLVGQSMLFAGVATLRSVKDVASADSALPTFYKLGFFLAAIWFGVNLLHHGFTRTKLKGYTGWRFWLSWVYIHKSWWWMGFVAPVGLLVTWCQLWQG